MIINVDAATAPPQDPLAGAGIPNFLLMEKAELCWSGLTLYKHPSLSCTQLMQKAFLAGLPPGR